MGCDFFVNTAWDSGTSMSSWFAQNPWLATWYDNEYAPDTLAASDLVYGTTSFNSMSTVMNKLTGGETICLCSNASLQIKHNSSASDDFTIVSAKNDDYPNGFTLTLSGNGSHKVNIECNMTIEDGANCQVSGAGLTVSSGNELNVNGSLTASEITGAGNVTVGAGASVTIDTYSASGTLTVGNGASITIDTYSGGGEIVLDGSATLNITTFTGGTPTIAINIPSTTGVLPYKELMANSSINFNTAVEDIGNEPVCVVNDHALYYAPKDYYYVNSGYTGSAIPDVLAASGMSRTTVGAAVAAGGTAGSIFVTGGSFGVTAGEAVAFNALNTQILGVVTGSPAKIVNEALQFTSSVAGGECIVSASTFTFTKAGGANTHLEINGGTFGKTTVGGDFVTQGNVFRTGDINLTINGGEFVSTVGGGMAYTPKNTDGSVSLVGDVNFLITGGTFNRRLYGGNICCNGFGGQTALTGDVNLTIDASKNVIAFKEHIVAGCFDSGAIEGNTNVTLTGLGANLKTKTDDGLEAFNGIILGGSGATYIRTTGDTRECTSFVSGSRNLAFEKFTGVFAGEIKAFQSISFGTTTAVEFTNSKLNLRDVSEWNIAFGSTVTATNGSNNFADDSLVLTGWDEVSPWTVMSGKEAFFTNWNAFDSVSLCGQTAAFETENSRWTSDDYQLTLETSGDTKMLVLAAKA